MSNLWILNQFMGNKSCNADAASMTKLNKHCSVMIIQTCNKFREIPFIGYLIMTQFVFFFQETQGNNSLHTGEILTKCNNVLW